MTQPHRRRGAARTVGVASALLAALAIVAGCTSTTTSGQPDTSAAAAATTGGGPAAPSSGAASGTTSGAATSSSPAAPPARPVHIQLKFSDGNTFGVGIPVIAFFSRKITDATALQNATTLKINDKAVTGGRWYFEPVSGHPGYPLEGDYRLQNPWPAHSSIFVDIAAKGLSAGSGLAYNDSLTLSFSTGASHIAVVNNATHELTLSVDGKVEGTYPVSLGASDTPTAHGTKVIMEKGRSICMSGPGYHECGVKYTQRLTYGGEYLHSAPWNCLHASGCVGPYNNIGHANSSNGCTNLLPGDAAKLYSILRIGDIVKFPNADGPQMTMGAGYGDWNVSWSEWLTGGAVSRI
jgi:lipoprotein-anchoring transpeptidase ErfK/SrfK